MKVKKILQKLELPPWYRDRIPLLYIDGELAAISDYIISDLFNNEDKNNGTDLYDEDLTLAHSIPFIHNLGYVFFPANNTWHGLEKGKNINHRKCVLINYVTFKTDFKLW